MKKFLAILMLSLALPAFAQHHGHFRHHHRHHHGGGWGWVAPAVIGGLVVYGATRPDPVVIQQQPVIINPADTVIIDGVVYKKQLVQIDGVWREVLIKV